MNPFNEDTVLDDHHWINVQDPIKHMFLALTKAIKTQSNQIKDLERKISTQCVSKEQIEFILQNKLELCCSKDDALQIIRIIENKVDKKDMNISQQQLNELSINTNQLSQLSNVHNHTLSELNSRIDNIYQQIKPMALELIEPLHSYVDRQISNTINDIDRKLAIKADLHHVETAIPQKVEDLFRALNMKVNDLSNHMISSEELQKELEHKANQQDIRLIHREVENKVSKDDLQSFVSPQIQSIGVTLHQLELTLQSQNEINKNLIHELQDNSKEIQKVQDNLLKRAAMDPFDNKVPPQMTKLVESLVDGMITDRGLDGLSKEMIHESLSSQSDYVMQQMTIMNESLRLELLAKHQDDLDSVQSNLIARCEEISEKHQKTRVAVKELSINVAKALSKKLDIKAFKSIFQGFHGDNPLHSFNDIESPVEYNPIPSSHTTTHEQNDEFSMVLQSLQQKYASNNHHDFQEFEDPEQTDRPMESRTTTRLHPKPMTRSQVKGGASKASPDQTIDYSIIKREVEILKNKLDKELDSIRLEMEPIQLEIKEIRNAMASKAATSNKIDPSKVLKTSSTVVGLKKAVDTLDWRIALGEVSGTLKKELSEKASKEDLQEVLNHDIEPWKKQLQNVVKRFDVAEEHGILLTKVEKELLKLRNKISSEIIGARYYPIHDDEYLKQIIRVMDRFLWTSGKIYPMNNGVLTNNPVEPTDVGGQIRYNGWIPWDLQIINESPAIIVWNKQSHEVTIRIPGLYKICVAVFSGEMVVMQVFLNDEPIFSNQPVRMNSPTNPSPVDSYYYPMHRPYSSTIPSFDLTAESMREFNESSFPIDRYLLRRFNHSVGEVSSIRIEEYVSLPQDARLSVKYQSRDSAQAFFSIRKM